MLLSYSHTSTHVLNSSILLCPQFINLTIYFNSHNFHPVPNHLPQYLTESLMSVNEHDNFARLPTEVGPIEDANPNLYLLPPTPNLSTKQPAYLSITTYLPIYPSIYKVRMQFLSQYSTWLRRIVFLHPSLLPLSPALRQGLVMALLREAVPVVVPPGQLVESTLLSARGWEAGLDLVVFRRGTAQAFISSSSSSSSSPAAAVAAPLCSSSLGGRGRGGGGGGGVGVGGGGVGVGGGGGPGRTSVSFVVTPGAVLLPECFLIMRDEEEARKEEAYRWVISITRLLCWLCLLRLLRLLYPCLLSLSLDFQ